LDGDSRTVKPAAARLLVAPPQSAATQRHLTSINSRQFVPRDTSVVEMADAIMTTGNAVYLASSSHYGRRSVG
jgi:hypothetical protein